MANKKEWMMTGKYGPDSEGTVKRCPGVNKIYNRVTVIKSARRNVTRVTFVEIPNESKPRNRALT